MIVGICIPSPSLTHGIHTPILDGQTTCIEVDGPPADRPAVLGGSSFHALWQVALGTNLSDASLNLKVVSGIFILT